MVKLIQKLAKERSLTVLVGEHKMDVVFFHSSKIRVRHEGRIIFEGVAGRGEEKQRGFEGVHWGER